MQYGLRGILKRGRRRERNDGERGQIMVLFTLALVVLMASAAIVIDAGLLRTDAARLQNALDAGALAAAQSLPATNANAADVKATAVSYVTANYPGVAAPETEFRCIIGADSSGGPHLIDMPAICNVAPGSAWICTAALCWAPCDPNVHSTDVCNAVVLKDSVVQPYTFGRVVGINSGSTGSLQAAACTGPCGPTNPVDVVLTIDRTGSMRGLEQTLVDGADAVLQAYDPTVQHVALGMIGPSSDTAPCSTGAYGKALAYGNPTPPSIANSNATNVQSATNANSGAATLVIPKPTSTATGDLLVAGITVDGGSATSVTAPDAGWTQIRRTDNDTNVSVVSFWKLAGASEGNNYTFTLSPGARAVGGILRVTGVDTANPIDVSGENTENSTSVQAPSITTTTAQTTLIGFFGTGTQTTFGTATSMTERFDQQQGNNAGPSLAGDADSAATAGATGNRTATAGASAQWAAQMIAVRPEKTYAGGYPGSSPAYSDQFLADNMSKWIPVGLTGTSDADVLEAFRNPNGTVNTSSTISKTIGCVLPNNPLTNGTDQASPFDFATAYLLGTSASPRHARPGVPTGIIFETDGTPQTQNYTCQQAQTAASAAKAKGIEVFTIGFFASNQAGDLCPDTSGTVVAQDGRPVAGRHGDQLGHGQVEWMRRGREHRQRPLLLCPGCKPAG